MAILLLVGGNAALKMGGWNEYAFECVNRYVQMHSRVKEKGNHFIIYLKVNLTPVVTIENSQDELRIQNSKQVIIYYTVLMMMTMMKMLACGHVVFCIMIITVAD